MWMSRSPGMSRLLLLCIVIPGMVFLISGCKEDTSLVEPDDTEQNPALTADELVAAYTEALSDLDYEAYEQTLDEGFKFILLPETVEDIIHPTPYLSREEDLQFTGNMLEAITGFEIVLDGVGSWEAEDDTNAYFPGVLHRVYHIHAEVGDADRGITYIVDGLVTFYVSSHEVTAGGETVTAWLLKGQHDHTGHKETENCTLSNVKSLYR